MEGRPSGLQGWQRGAEIAITSIIINPSGPPLPPTAPDRFPFLVHLRPGAVYRETKVLELLETLQGFSRLISLDFSGLKLILTNRHLDTFLATPRAQYIVSLSLADCAKLTEKGLEGLAAPGVLPQLLDLSLNNCHWKAVTGPCLDKVLEDRPLTALDLGHCREFNAGRLGLLDDKPLTSTGLSWLDLNGLLDGIDGGLIKKLSQKPLRFLDLTSYYEMRNPMFSRLIEGHRLEEINLDGCWKLTWEGLSGLMDMPIHTLNLSAVECNLNCIKKLLGALPLTSLDVGHMPHLRDEGLAALRGKALRYLSVEKCTKITEAGLGHLTGMPLTCLNAQKSRWSHAFLVLRGFQGDWKSMHRINFC